MKQLFSLPVSGYLFWRISRTSSLKHCLSQCRTYFGALKSAQEIHKDVYSKRKTVHPRKRFLSNNEQSLVLMNFDVWMYPKLSCVIRDLKCFLSLIGSFGHFSRPEFAHLASGALHVVTSLLSQFRFQELKGLLTTECLKEVEQNLESWTERDASFLSFKSENLVTDIACDFLIFSDESNKKKFIEIRVIHYVWLKYSPEIQIKEVRDAVNKVPFPNFKDSSGNIMAVYNTKFIREITRGIFDQWTMKKINLRVYPHVLIKGSHL